MGVPPESSLPPDRAILAGCLEAREEILEAYLFGSRARGDDRADSDIDVAVTLDPARSAPAPFGYASELAAALTTSLGGTTVDIVVLNDAPPLLYHRVLRDGIRLFSRHLPSTTTREGRALSRYCDYLPQLRRIDTELRERIRRGEFGR